jgi:hypothetical protein
MSKFKLGQTWRTRDGETCTIVLVEDSLATDYPICSDLYEGHWHRPDGTSCHACKDDLIELLSDPGTTSTSSTVEIARKYDNLELKVAGVDGHLVTLFESDLSGDPWTEVPEGQKLTKRYVRVGALKPPADSRPRGNTMTEPVQIPIPVSNLQQFRTALEAGLEAAKNRRHQVCGDRNAGNRLLAWHDNEVFTIEQALEQINAKLNPPSHPV